MRPHELCCIFVSTVKLNVLSIYIVKIYIICEAIL
nr:MAG TPA: protein of unknown function (DUF5433) [Crassvirales sp.]